MPPKVLINVSDDTIYGFYTKKVHCKWSKVKDKLVKKAVLNVFWKLNKYKNIIHTPNISI